MNYKFGIGINLLFVVLLIYRCFSYYLMITPVVSYTELPKQIVSSKDDLISLHDLKYDERVSIYDSFFLNQALPHRTKRRFSNAEKGNVFLNVVLIEMRQTLPKRFLYALYNIAHIYGGRNIALTLVVHVDAAAYVQKMLDTKWDNVKVLVFGTPKVKFAITDYNLLLTSLLFWKKFQTEFVLITHTDSMILRPIDDWMYSYDLIGAPWVDKNTENKTRPQVGNGGYTLRKVSAMIQLTQNVVYTKKNPKGLLYEDVWFADNLDNVPSEDIALFFGCEVYCSNTIPTGVHKLYHHPRTFEISGDILRLFEKSCSVDFSRNICS
jgi:hypothetical protein